MFEGCACGGEGSTLYEKKLKSNRGLCDALIVHAASEP
jgi:hypothetical protein